MYYSNKFGTLLPLEFGTVLRNPQNSGFPLEFSITLPNGNLPKIFREYVNLLLIGLRDGLSFL